MPVFGALILIILAYFKYMGDGPVYDSIIEATLEKKCRTYWWTSLLFIQNYVNPFNEVKMLFCDIIISTPFGNDYYCYCTDLSIHKHLFTT